MSYHGPSLQDQLAPGNACFGCGPANPHGLQIKSHVEGKTVVMEWQPEKRHEAFDGVLSGGIIGTLMDCHSNWTAIWALMEAGGLDSPPCMVTAEYHVYMKRPTPTERPVRIVATPGKVDGDRVEVQAELIAGGRVCATSTGLFVAVKPGHPAYHRW